LHPKSPLHHFQIDIEMVRRISPQRSAKAEFVRFAREPDQGDGVAPFLVKRVGPILQKNPVQIGDCGQVARVEAKEDCFPDGRSRQSISMLRYKGQHGFPGRDKVFFWGNEGAAIVNTEIGSGT
jgi:hypothetical protein